MPKVAQAGTGTASYLIRQAGAGEIELVSGLEGALETEWVETEAELEHTWRIIPQQGNTVPFFQWFRTEAPIVFTVYTTPRTDELVIVV